MPPISCQPQARRTGCHHKPPLVLWAAGSCAQMRQEPLQIYFTLPPTQPQTSFDASKMPPCEDDSQQCRGWDAQHGQQGSDILERLGTMLLCTCSYMGVRPEKFSNLRMRMYLCVGESARHKALRALRVAGRVDSVLHCFCLQANVNLSMHWTTHPVPAALPVCKPCVAQH